MPLTHIVFVYKQLITGVGHDGGSHNALHHCFLLPHSFDKYVKQNYTFLLLPITNISRLGVSRVIHEDSPVFSKSFITSFNPKTLIFTDCLKEHGTHEIYQVCVPRECRYGGAVIPPVIPHASCSSHVFTRENGSGH